jgi:ATP-dependent RNA helicase SUPV3L1/SUV3
MLRFHGAGRGKDGARPFLPPPGATSLPVEAGVSPLDYAAAGYRVAGPRAVRVDALEALAEALMSARSAQAFALPAGAASLIGCPAGAFEEVLRALGWRKAKKAEGEAPALWRPPAARPAAKRPALRSRNDMERRGEPVHSPFAALAALAAPASKSPRRRRRPARRAS